MHPFSPVWVCIPGAHIIPLRSRLQHTEFSKEPICTASSTYQKKKIEQLKSLALPEAEFNKQIANVLAKECLCVGLSNAAVKTYHLDPLLKKSTAVNICPGPNIAYFSRIDRSRK